MFKIGQEIIVTKDFEVDLDNGKILKVKKGDEALATRIGLKIMSGEAEGITHYYDYKKREYDTENIARRILENIKYDIIGFTDLMVIEEIDDKVVLDSILEELEKFI